LYDEAAVRLAERGYPLLAIDTTYTPVRAVADRLAERIAALAGVRHPRHDTA